MPEHAQENNELMREQLKAQFQALVTSGEEATPLKVADAFSLSQRFSAAGGMRGNFHAFEVIDALRNGTRPDATTASLAKLEFDLNTKGFAGDKTKGLLAGLDEEALKKATKFCQSVDQAYDNLFHR